MEINQEPQSSQEICFPGLYQKDFRLFIEVLISDRKFNAFINTGSRMSYIGRDAADHADKCGLFRIDYEQKVTVLGKEFRIDGVYFIPFKIGSVKMEAAFPAVDDKAVEVVLGVDVLSRLDCLLDIKNRKWYNQSSKKDSRKRSLEDSETDRNGSEGSDEHFDHSSTKHKKLKMGNEDFIPLSFSENERPNSEEAVHKETDSNRNAESFVKDTLERLKNLESIDLISLSILSCTKIERHGNAQENVTNTIIPEYTEWTETNDFIPLSNKQNLTCSDNRTVEIVSHPPQIVQSTTSMNESIQNIYSEKYERTTRSRIIERMKRSLKMNQSKNESVSYSSPVSVTLNNTNNSSSVLENYAERNRSDIYRSFRFSINNLTNENSFLEGDIRGKQSTFFWEFQKNFEKESSEVAPVGEVSEKITHKWFTSPSDGSCFPVCVTSLKSDLPSSRIGVQDSIQDRGGKTCVEGDKSLVRIEQDPQSVKFNEHAPENLKILQELEQSKQEQSKDGTNEIEMNENSSGSTNFHSFSFILPEHNFIIRNERQESCCVVPRNTESLNIHDPKEQIPQSIKFLDPTVEGQTEDIFEQVNIPEHSIPEEFNSDPKVFQNNETGKEGSNCWNLRQEFNYPEQDKESALQRSGQEFKLLHDFEIKKEVSTEINSEKSSGSCPEASTEVKDHKETSVTAQQSSNSSTSEEQRNEDVQEYGNIDEESSVFTCETEPANSEKVDSLTSVEVFKTVACPAIQEIRKRLLKKCSTRRKKNSSDKRKSLASSCHQPRKSKKKKTLLSRPEPYHSRPYNHSNLNRYPSTYYNYHSNSCLYYSHPYSSMNFDTRRWLNSSWGPNYPLMYRERYNSNYYNSY